MRKITAYDLQHISVTDIRTIEKVALTLLAIILNLREGETLEFEYFTIHKADNYGTFYIDYDPQKLAMELAKLLEEGEIPESVKKDVEYILRRWKGGKQS